MSNTSDQPSRQPSSPNMDNNKNNLPLRSSPLTLPPTPSKNKPPFKPLYTTPTMDPPTPSPPSFASAYTRLLASQSDLKAELSLLYRENRRLRALLDSVPESSIPIAALDLRTNKDAAQLNDLVDPSEQEDYENGKMDAETFNGRRILGAIEIDCASLGDEIEAMEKENESLRKKGRQRGARKAWLKGGKEMVGLEEKDEDEDEDEEKVGSLGSDVIDFGFEGGEKVMSGVEGKARRGVTGLGFDGEDEVVGSGESEEKETAAIRGRLRILAKGIAGFEKSKITIRDVEDELKTLKEIAKNGGAATDAGVPGAGGSKSTAETADEKEKGITAFDQVGKFGEGAQNESDSAEN